MQDDLPVVAFASDAAWTTCEPCYSAMAEAWAALTPVEQEEVLREVA